MNVCPLFVFVKPDGDETVQVHLPRRLVLDVARLIEHTPPPQVTVTPDAVTVRLPANDPRVHEAYRIGACDALWWKAWLAGVVGVDVTTRDHVMLRFVASPDPSLPPAPEFTAWGDVGSDRILLLPNDCPARSIRFLGNRAPANHLAAPALHAPRRWVWLDYDYVAGAWETCAVLERARGEQEETIMRHANVWRALVWARGWLGWDDCQARPPEAETALHPHGS